jgi:predicted nucleotidyltransferase
MTRSINDSAKRKNHYLCNMRLSTTEIQAIRDVVRRHDPDARIRLFGSRLDDQLRGGDIDLLILSGTLTYRDKLKIRYQLKDRLGNRKIDLIITPKPQSAFQQHAFDNSADLI